MAFLIVYHLRCAVALSIKIKCYSRLFPKQFHHKDVKTLSTEWQTGNSVRAKCEYWRTRLSQAGVTDPETSADLIVAHVCGKKMIHEVNLNEKLPDSMSQRIDAMCLRRMDRVPVQYIIGEWDFHDMTLEMRAPVLIPRPETEELAAMVVTGWPHPYGEGRFVDIGCGSGAIGLYVLHQLRKTTCVAVDKSKVACDLTKTNAIKYNLQDKISVLHGDICESSFVSKLSQHGPFDVIVSNPPYITSSEMETLQEEVVRYEDRIALHGGEDGLDVVRQVLSVAPLLLKPRQGLLWLEVGLQHPQMIKDLVLPSPEKHLTYVRSVRDFSGRERFCCLKMAQ